MVPHFCNQFVTNVAFESEYRENTGNFLDTVIFYIVGRILVKCCSHICGVRNHFENEYCAGPFFEPLAAFDRLPGCRTIIGKIGRELPVSHSLACPAEKDTLASTC